MKYIMLLGAIAVFAPLSLFAEEVTPPPINPTITLTARKTSVVLGEPVLLSWKADNATRCESSGEWGYGTSKEIEGSQTVTPTKKIWYSSDGTSRAQTSYLYILHCYNQERRVTKSVTLTVDPTKSFLALSASYKSIKQGDVVTLTWSTHNAERCTASEGWSGEKPVSGGTETFMPDSTVHYWLECFSGNVSAKKEVVVTVVPRKAPVINYFKVAKQVIPPLGSAHLSWSANASTCIARDAWSGVKTLNGSQDVTPTGSLVAYTLECTRDGLIVTKTVQVSVADGPKNMTLSANKASVRDGEPVVLTWHAEQADSCMGFGSGWSQKNFLVDGTATVQPTYRAGSSASVYLLRCTRAGATLDKSLSLDVQVKPFFTFAGSDPSVESGKQIKLSWSADTAERCVASGGWSGEKQQTGDEMVIPKENGTYVLECYSRGASVKKSVYVSIKYPAGVQPFQESVQAPINSPPWPPIIFLGPNSSQQPSQSQSSLPTCRRTGCSGELCSDHDITNICMYLPEYACYQHSRCERFVSGSCGWVETTEYNQCMTGKKTAGQPLPPSVIGVPVKPLVNGGKISDGQQVKKIEPKKVVKKSAVVKKIVPKKIVPKKGKPTNTKKAKTGSKK